MKKLQKFCRISLYLEQIDKELFEVFEKMCALGYLQSRGNNGITFLYPENKEYRNKIIDTAYGKNPENISPMLKSLVITEYYSTPAAFGTEIVNLNNQSIKVEERDKDTVVLEKGIKLKKDPGFESLGHREMSVYRIIKGEMPLDNPMVDTRALRAKAYSKTGGGFADRTTLENHLSSTFLNEGMGVENIYIKKVYMHLNLLKNDQTMTLDQLKMHLGNDEFTDSYLLDKYCQKKCSDCFATLYNGLTSSNTKMSQITYQNYVDLKKEMLGSNDANRVVPKDPSRAIGIAIPMDIRARVQKFYGNDKDRLARDLFIVYSNVCRDLWQTYHNKEDSFTKWAYSCTNIYFKSDNLLSREYDVVRDLTLYGNLLKSDVFMYSPQAEFRSTDVDLPIPNELPTPLNYSLFSLCGLINKEHYKTTGGHSSKEAEIMFQGI
jgi:hypothetical protein